MNKNKSINIFQYIIVHATTKLNSMNKFHNRHSTIHQVHRLTDKISIALENQEATIIILLWSSYQTFLKH